MKLGRYLWCVLVYAPFLVQSAVQNAAPEARHAYSPDKQYMYDYTSSSRVYYDLDVTVEAKVILSAVQSTFSHTELAFQFNNSTLIWTTNRGEYKDTDYPFGDLSSWFSVSLDQDGAISSVHYPEGESLSVLAFKKAIVGMVGVSGSGVERVIEGSEVILTERTTRDRLSGSKTLTFNENGLLFSAEVDERMSHDSTMTTPLSGYPLHTHSSLVLTDEQLVGVVTDRPGDLASGSVEIEKVVDTVPLFQLLPTLTSTLTSCTSTRDTCTKSLVSLLKQLSPDDVANFVDRFFTSDEWSETSMVLIDALSQLEASKQSHAIGNSLSRHVLESAQNDEIILSSVLRKFTRGIFLPDRTSVDSVLGVVTGNQDQLSSLELTQQALLALGGMSWSLRETDPELSNEVLDTLHSLLDQYHQGATDHPHDDETSRLRRSVSMVTDMYDPVMHATLIDSLGNARSERSISRLASHVTESHDRTSRSHDLSIRHAAVNALKGIETDESAEVILQAVETTPHPSVRQLAVNAYQSHSRRRRDLSHIAEDSHRSKRQVDNSIDHVTNVTMPTVTWSREFGDSNISVDVRRMLRNSFDIAATAPLSSHYTFSLHDTTSFDANLHLSDGEQHSEMLRTEVCLQGTATYDANILTDVNYNLTSHQFNRHSAIVPELQNAFRDSYTQITTTQSSYSDLESLIQTSIDNIPSRFSAVEDSLVSYERVVDGIGGDFVLKRQVGDLYLSLNQSFVEARGLALGSVQSMSDALTTLLPSLPMALTSSLLVEGQPFIDSTFHVPYLPFAPQQAMANIFNIIISAESSFSDLESSVYNLLNQTGRFGSNHAWLSPSLRSATSQLASLSAEISEAISTAEICVGQTYDGASLDDLRTLQSAVGVHLRSSLSLLESVGSEIVEGSERVSSAYRASKDGLLSLQLAYDKALTEIDTIFGAKFHPSFPRRLRPCNVTCGVYPSTGDGQYGDGIDLLLEENQIVAPFSSYIQSLEPTSLPSDLRPLYMAHIGSTLIIPAEPSLRDIRIIVPNLFLPLSVTMATTVVQSGVVITDYTLNVSPPDTAPYIHVEAFKVQNGVWSRIDPTQFVQPLYERQVGVDLDCNDVVVYVGGVVIERRSLLTSTDVVMEMIGDPLVQGIPGHEFPQPFDLVVTGDDVISSSVQGVNSSDVKFFQSSTFVMVGPIPVQFDFSSVGSYQLSYSPSINLLSKTLNLQTTPSILAKAQGSMRVGTTVFALVEFSGTVLESSLPLTMSQDFSKWPQVASSAMDVVLVPSTLTLTSQLFQLTGAGDFAEQEILETNTLWRYSIPPFNRSEFYYRGSLTDQTPPVFTPLEYSIDQLDCFVRQLPGRSHGNPAFELEFKVVDSESLLNISYRVGTFVNGDDIIDKTEIAGNRIVVANELVSDQELFFTVSAENLNQFETFVSCKLPNDAYFDRSPPLARINPIRELSSHPSMIHALIVLFDEVGFNDLQEVAIGLVPGESGEGVMGWRELNASLIETRPDEMGDVLNLFSFGRSGRLVGDILQAATSIGDLATCATMCNTDTNCLSFDYSRQESTCILHDSIEGPKESQNNFIQNPFQSSQQNIEDFENIFSTPELQASGSYNHYEKLGAGNSALVSFSGLSFEHDEMYYINVRLRNKLGVINFVSSDGFLVDLTPPNPGRIRNASSDDIVVGGCGLSPVTPGCIDDSGAPNHRIIVDGPGSASVFNGPIPLLDAMYTGTNNYITANWNGFSDAQSRLYAFTWCIGRSIGSCDLLSPRDPHARLGLTTRESWTNTGLAGFQNLSDGSYYITIQAINNVEYGGPLATTVHHTTPYIIDTTPPNISEVYNIQYNISTNQLSLDYVVSDEGSGVANVSIALGRTPRDTSLLSWTVLGSGGRGLVAVVIPDGVPAWVKLRATNNAGLRSLAVAEDTIMVDRSPPLSGTVNDGSLISLDADYQSSLDMLCVNWEGFRDPESGVTSIEWTVSRTSSFDSGFIVRVLNSSELANRFACSPGLPLVHNTTYYSFLSVSNGAMNTQSVTVQSDGVRTDNTPPVPGSVTDGPDSSIDIQFSSSQTTFSATWSGFYDYESGIDSYTIAVYRQTMGSSSIEVVHEGRLSGTMEEIYLNYFSFSNGDFIFVAIEAFNGAGLSSAQNSSGYIIDLTPPELLYIVDGLNPLVDEMYQASSDSIQVAWDISDLESGISQIEGAIFEIRGSSRFRIHPNPLLTDRLTENIPVSDSSWSVSDTLQLSSGVRYIVSLSFTNGAGLQSVFETNGIVVDLTQPVIELVSIMSDTYTDLNAIDTTEIITNSNQISVRWSALDPESGLAEYLVGVVDENLASISPNVTFDGSSMGGLIENLALTPGDGLYSVVVVAVNNVGMTSAPAYSRQFRVAMGDSAGVVIDGGAPDITDIDYTDELTAVTAQFYGFRSETCGGISRYEWAVGVANAEGDVVKESVMSFTTRGVVTVDPLGSGYAQTSVPNLSSFAGQRLFITVRGINDCGGILESTSNGFVIVTSPPSLRVVGTGPNAIEHAQSGVDVNVHDVYQSVYRYSSLWDAVEDVSGGHERTRVKVGTYPGGDDIEQEREVSENYIRGTISSPEGVPLFVTVTAEDSAGLESVAFSDPVVLDTSLPVSGEMTSSIFLYPNALQYLLDDPSQPLTGVLYLEWTGVLDPESDISELAVSVGTSQNDQSVLSKTTLTGGANLTSYQSPFLTFDPRITVLYPTLYVTNGAGLEIIFHFASVVCDYSSPIIQGAVVVQSNAESAVYSPGNLTINYRGMSPAVCLYDSDVVNLGFLQTPADVCSRYEMSIGTSPGKDNLQQYRPIKQNNIAPQSSSLLGDDATQFFNIKLSDINLTPAGRNAVYFNIRCFTKKGQYTTLSSNPIFIKSETTSEESWIFDGAESGVDIECQDSTTEIKGQVYVGVNCPIRRAYWSIERTDHVLEQEDVEIEISDIVYSSPDPQFSSFIALSDNRPISFTNTFSLETDQVSLSTDQSYRILFHAIDYCGKTHRLNSNGVTIVTEGVVPGVVQDGCVRSQDFKYQASTSQLCSHWSGFGGGLPGCQQQIGFYEVAVGSDREFPSTRTDIVPFTNVGLNTSFVFTSLDLIADEVYYITVRAHAVSGAFVDSTSNGISVGHGQMIIAGEISLDEFQSDTSTLSLHWSDFESDVPIRSYELALGTIEFDSEELNLFCEDTTSDFVGEFDQFGFTNQNLDTSATFQSLGLFPNTTYYAVLRVIDQADKCLAVISDDGVTIDTSPPLYDSAPDFVQVGTEASRSLEVSPEIIVYAGESERIEVTWDSFYDLESGIESYEVAIYSQTVCGEDSSLSVPVAEFTSVDEEHEITFDGLDLRVGITYVAVVRATNNAGLSSRALSLPFVVDSRLFFSGSVKDGPTWENDVTFQSDLSMLSATFTHAILPPPTPGVTMSGPCPNTTLYTLSEFNDAWSTIETRDPSRQSNTSLVYSRALVNLSTSGLSGIAITTRRDEGVPQEQILTGGYQTRVPISNGGIVSVDILAARGTMDLEANSVTSVLFIDGGQAHSVAIFEPEFETFEFPDSDDFNAFGLQIYRGTSDNEQERVVLWARSHDPIGTPVYVSHDLSHLNLSEIHTFELDFKFQQLDIDQTRYVNLYIDGVLETALYGLPGFSDDTRLVLHVFNRLGYIPPITSPFDIPTVQALFRNVYLPLRIGHLCDYGVPFFSQGSPVVEFRGGVGSRPGADDIVEFKTISSPCLTCLPTTPCPLFGCDSNCTLEDPYTIPVSFLNLTLSPGNSVRQINQSDGSVADGTTLSTLLTGHFQPAVYFVTVEAITASGGRFRSTSNGVTIDTTPPTLVSPIEQFDVSFSLTEPSRFQGNDSAIAASWEFDDVQSGIVEYHWSIGSEPYGEDIQALESVGMATMAINSNLFGILQGNTTYYVTVLAINRAGLSSNATSDGITYIGTELNVTELESFVRLEFIDVVLTLEGDNGTLVNVVRIEREDRASVSWVGVGEDVEEIFWSIGSEGSPPRVDVFPRTQVSFNNSQSATVDRGLLILDDQPFANISEVIALAEGKEEDPADNEFFFEPGRLLYHSVEFCNFVHRCSVVDTSPSILIRTKDTQASSTVLGEQVIVTSSQQIPQGASPNGLPSLDKAYTLTIATTGLDPGSRLVTGFLNQSDVTQNYRIATPYISDPFETMAQTSREIARRFTEVGGPSFFVSFLGQDSLFSALEVNVSFDGSLDWAAAVPELAYWDIDEQVWREVEATCMNDSTVDWPSLTISVHVCSTLLNPGSTNRPPSLTRRRRQSGPNPNTTLTSGMGSGIGSGMFSDPDTTFAPSNFLDRPTQFIVIRVGNTSTNTPPTLNLPTDPLIVFEDGGRVEYQLEYFDAEGDLVGFHISSLPRLGNVTLSIDGLLTFEPCANCIGMDMLDVYIVERPFGESHTPLSATGRLFAQIQNVNDIPQVYFYHGEESLNQLTSNRTITTYIDGNRTSPVIVGRIAGIDFDGYNDDLEIFVQGGQHGSAGSEIWLDAVNVPESLPISFSDGPNPVQSYSDYITFVGGYITYLPDSRDFTGEDAIMVLVRDSNRVSSVSLTLLVEVLPSLCENNGVCGGSEMDPNCTDIEMRRAGFDGYNCSCLLGYGGHFCEIQTSTPSPEPVRVCPLGVPLVQCDGDPCQDAVCPSHPDAVCTANYCGACTAQWSLADGSPVTCHADVIDICTSRAPGVSELSCLSTTCDCPSHPFQCPEDSVLVEVRVNDCCVSFECVCPNISCPFLMECGHGVQPIPSYHGNQFPGRCCPSYDYLDINECLDSSQNMCSDACINEDNTYSCSCPSGTSLAQNGASCGVCPYNGMEYLHGDRVMIGCNWCVCRGDNLSGERWHCTAAPCERGCVSDGQFYTVGQVLVHDQLLCSCEATDAAAEWMCSMNTA